MLTMGFFEGSLGCVATTMLVEGDFYGRSWLGWWRGRIFLGVLGEISISLVFLVNS